MACEATLSAISVSCTDLYTGGLKSLMLFNRQDLAEVVLDEATGLFTMATSAFATGVELTFNNKDAFSNFTDVMTADASGSRSAVPTIQMEFTRMTAPTRSSLQVLTQAGAEIVAALETAAGTQHLVGMEFGLMATSIDGATGANRSDKNRFQLTLTGEENSLSYHPTATTDWESLTVAP